MSICAAALDLPSYSRIGVNKWNLYLIFRHSWFVLDWRWICKTFVWSAIHSSIYSYKNKLAIIGISNQREQSPVLVVWIRWPVALTEATFQLQNPACSYSTITKGSQMPIAVNTRPLDPLRMKRSANSTLLTVGPRCGHWTVSVITFHTNEGEALYDLPMLIRFADILIISSCAFFKFLKACPSLHKRSLHHQMLFYRVF